MVPLRIAFDMDGTLADLASAYADMEDRLFGQKSADHDAPMPEEREQQQYGGAEEAPSTELSATTRYNPPRDDRPSRRRGSSRHREQVWQAIEATPDFWTTLKPIDPGAVERLYALTAEHHWEVFFITQRPATAGGTVQRQTHQWLVEHGYKTPSVIPLSRGRGRAASVLHLDYLVDDSPQNCFDVLSDSSARAILLIDGDDDVSERNARRLGIATARDIAGALDLLVEATLASANPTLFDKLRKMVGWR